MPKRVDHFKVVFETLGESRRGFFTRAVPLQFQETILSAIGSRGGGRYNAANTFEMYYLGDTVDTVARETGMMIRNDLGKIVPAQHPPKIVMTINYSLQRLVDLTDPQIVKTLGINPKALLVEWKDIVKAGRVPVTHELGAAALDSGIEGLIVPSARNAGGINITVIKDNMLVDSYIEIHDAKGFGPAVTTRVEGRKER